MLIILKEGEIATAVKRHLATQGINLAGKAVTIEFTATRANGGGIRADVSIDEIGEDIPGFTNADGETEAKVDTKPVLTAVASGAAVAAEVADTTKPAVKSVKEIAAAAAAVVLPEDTTGTGTAAVAETPVKATSSLFGS